VYTTPKKINKGSNPHSGTGSFTIQQPKQIAPTYATETIAIAISLIERA